MTRADLLALAQRVEREKPSRELDAAILAAVRPDEHARLEANAAAGVERAHGNKIFERDKTIRRLAFSDCPRYTTSLDAAASLVPPGWWVERIEQLSKPDSDGNQWVCVLDSEAIIAVAAAAPTEPRARTAAALRAMAEEAK